MGGSLKGARAESLERTSSPRRCCAASLTEAETSAVVGALRVRAGHSVADPVPDDDIRRVVQALVYEGADEAEVYRVREAMRRAGDRVTSHT